MDTSTSSQMSPVPDDRDLNMNANESGTTTTTGAASSETLMTQNIGAVAIPGLGAPAPVTGRQRDVWRLFSQNPNVAIGTGIVIFFVLVAIFGPLFVHTDPNAFSATQSAPPSAAHLLGTTQTGQDVFAQLIVGTRTSIFWGFFTAICVSIVSIVIGLSAGYFGGLVDNVLTMLTNVFLVLPAVPLAIVLGSFFQSKDAWTIPLVLTVTSWAYAARVLRAQTMSMRGRDFVEAARASGESSWRIIFVEILPNEIAIVVAGFIGTVLYVLLAAVGLNFVGVGDVTTPSWGGMLFWAQNADAILLGNWWWFLPPGLCVAVLGAALALINSGIDEVANPRLRREIKPRVRKAKKEVVAA